MIIDYELLLFGQMFRWMMDLSTIPCVHKQLRDWHFARICYQNFSSSGCSRSQMTPDADLLSRCYHDAQMTVWNALGQKACCGKLRTDVSVCAHTMEKPTAQLA